MPGLIHPETLPTGQGLWVAEEVKEVIHLLHNGYSPLGWEGDPMLALYRTGDDRWELWRHEEQSHDQMVLVMRSKPGAHLNAAEIILMLVTHDHRRGYDPIQDVIDANTAIEREAERKLDETVSDAADRVAHGLLKDNGIRTQWAGWA